MAQRYPIDVEVRPDRAIRGSRRVKSSLRDVRTEADKTKGALLNLFAGIGAGVAISRGIGLLAQFGQEMSTVRAVSGATDRQFQQLQKTARDLGRTTRFTATQAAEGMTFLSRAGFDANETLGSIEGTLKLAQAGNMDLGSSADIASNALQGFRLSVDQTTRMVDVMALTTNSSNTNLRQLGDALKYVAPISAGLGVSLEETSAAIGALSNAGIQGEMAGTSLRRVLIGLQKQTKEGEAVLKKYGLTIDDIAVTNTGSLTKSLEMLAAQGIETADAMTLFGLRGGPGFEVLQSSVEDVDRMNSALLNAEGTADRMAATMDDNLNGAILRAVSAIQDLVLGLGEAGVTDALITGLEAGTGVMRLMAENSDILLALMVALTIRGVLPLAASLAGPLVTSLRATAAGFAAMSLSMGTARAAGYALLAPMRLIAAHPIGFALTGIALGFTLLNRNSREAYDPVDRINEALDGTGEAMQELDRWVRAAAVQDAGDQARESAEYFSGLADETNRFALALRDATVQQFISSMAKAGAEIQEQQAALDELTEKRNALLKRDFGYGIASGLDLGFEGNFDQELRRLGAEEIAIRLGVDLSEYRQAEGSIRASIAGLESRATGVLGNLLTDEQLADIQGKLASLSIGDAAIAFRDALRKNFPTEETGGGGSARSSFEEEFSALQEMTAAIRQNEAAQERANKIKEIAEEIERELTDAERERVTAELMLQQTLRDQKDHEKRIQNITQEVELLGMNAREAEIMAEIYRAEAESLLGLTDAQEKSLRARIEELQAARDGKAIEERLGAIQQETELLGKIGIEREIHSEIMRLETQLQRDLTDVEKGWLDNAIRVNDAARVRNDIMEAAQQPFEREIQYMRELNNLYASGAIGLDAYNRALQENRTANAVRSLDSELNANGGNIRASEFEQGRRDTELLLRALEGGGVDDGSQQTFMGFTGQEIGVSGEMDRLRDQTQERLQLIRDARAQELLTEEEFIARKMEIFDQSQREQKDILMAGLATQFAAAEQGFGALTDSLRDAAGERSGIYKTMLVATKAFAIAEAMINIQRGIAEAAANPFPYNLAAMGTVAAATASIISNIQQVRAAFRDGGLPIPESQPGLMGGRGGPRDDQNLIRISRGEYIVRAAVVRNNLPMLEHLNRFGSLPANDNTPAYRGGGLPAGVAAGPGYGTSRGRGDQTVNIDVGGVSIYVPEGTTAKEAEQIGRDVIRGMVLEVMREESEPMGYLDQTYAKAG